MLGKLIKHEFRATSGFMALLCAGLIGFAGLSRLFMLLDDMFGMFSFPLAISMFFYIALAVASVVLVYVIIIKRFYSNVYGDEGYLTLTLPVKRRKIILSKLIVGLVWIIIDVVVTIGSLCILTFSTEFVTSVLEAVRYMGLYFMQLRELLGIPAALIIVELVIAAIIGLVNSVLVFYTAISIRQLFTGHRLIGSVVGYMMVSAAGRIITGVFGYLFGFTQNGLNNIINLIRTGRQIDGIMSFNLQVNMIMYLVIFAAMTAGLFAVTNLIMKRAVNLQ